MPFTEIQMDLEIVILNKVRQKEKYHMISFRWNLKKMKQTNLLQNRNRLTELENELVVNGGRLGEGDDQGVWDQQVHTSVFKIDNQQGPTVQHR